MHYVPVDLPCITSACTILRLEYLWGVHSKGGSFCVFSYDGILCLLLILVFILFIVIFLMVNCSTSTLVFDKVKVIYLKVVRIVQSNIWKVKA